MTTKAGDKGEVSYQSDVPAMQMDTDSEEVEFTYTFPEKWTMMGESKATLYVSCPDHDDMDIFIMVRKADKNGNLLKQINFPLKNLGKSSIDEVEDINPYKYIGPDGMLRASHRALDHKLAKPHRPEHDHNKEDKVRPGEIVKLEIGIWNGAIQWEAGEKLIVRVSGHDMRLAEFPQLRGTFTCINKGKHMLHFGGEYCSRIEIPTVSI